MTSSGAPGALTLRAEVTRKALHLASAVFPVVWGLGLVTATTVRSVLTGALVVAVTIEIARRRLPRLRAAFEALVGPLLRGHEHRAVTGATWLAATMLVSAYVFPPRAALAALWAAAVGDAAAALVGRLVALRRTAPPPSPSTPASPPSPASKTFAGSLACVLATAAGVWWLSDASLAAAGVIGFTAAAAERPRLAVDDNVRVALGAGFAAWVLGLG